MAKHCAYCANNCLRRIAGFDESDEYLMQAKIMVRVTVYNLL